VSYVVTDGASMLPIYHTGDLVVVARQDTYADGDIVAYRQGHVTILHRVIDGDASGWVTKGDGNESVDPGRPASEQLLGRAVLHLPGGGTWLRRAISPPVLAAFTFLMVAGLGATVRRRKRRRPAAMGRHTDTSGGGATAAAFAAISSPRSRAAAGVLAAVGLLGAGLGAAAWTRPVERSVTVPAPPPRTMTFSYATTVPRTPAYDDTTVTSPEPVFRTVADHVDVTFAYRGPPGTVGVAAELSVAGGWHATVPLVRQRSFTADTYTDVVRLDLDALAARAASGAEAAGLGAGEVAVAIVPRIGNPHGAPFVPALRLTLTPLALTVADGGLVVRDAASAPTKTTVPLYLRVFGRDVIGVSAARTGSAVLVLLVALAAAGLVLLARRSGQVTEGEVIRRRYGKLLVEVAPMAPPPGRPVVRVTEFKTLARLAERYGLLVLRWSTPTSATFVVPDETVTYWYCTDPASTGPGEQHVPEKPRVPGETPAPGADAVEAPYHWQLALPGAQDELTRLANRSLFEEEAQHAIDTGAGERPCLMLIDLDGFGALDEEHSRFAGDAVLLAVAERLRGAVRPRDLVARLDGEAFAVLFEDVGTMDMAAIAGRIVGTVNESISEHAQRAGVRASLGVARAGPGDDAAILMAHATAALAGAKAMTGARLAWFPEG
jgi:signal peptidase I